MNESRASQTKRPWQRVLRAGLLMIEAVVLAGLIVAVVTGARMPFGVIFGVLAVLAVTPTLLWWSWVDQRLARTLRLSRGRIWLRVLTALYGLLMLSPLLLFGLRMRDELPLPLLVWLMIWHLTLIVVGLGVLGVWLVRLTGGAARAVWRFARTHRPAGNLPDHDDDADADLATADGLTRRSFLTATLAVAPVVLVGSATASSLTSQGRFRVQRVRMQLERLPRRLRGLTITHVSDIHVGQLFRPEYLPALVDAVNALDSDVLAITGDVVNNSIDYLEPTCDAFAQMRSRYGRFFVIGNHDLIDSPHRAVEYLRRREPNFLEDECRTIEIDGERVQVAGLFWSRHEYVARAERTLMHVDPDVFTLALSHHPHAFDTLADGGVDLTLAGHTHGGQIMLTPPGAATPIGGGNLLFRYIWGEYWRAGRALYVTSGAGNWFPLRINAPAEIVQIQLT